MAVINKVLAALDSLGKTYKHHGNGYMAQCPAHTDNNPSLSIDFDDKRVLLKCFAHCSVNDITHALGMETKDLFEPDQRPRPSRQPVAVYDYYATDGTWLRKSRYEGKKFVWSHAVGSRFITGRVGKTPQLYQQSNVSPKAKVLNVCEGERDTDAIRNLGLDAVSVPDGAGSLHEAHVQWLINTGLNIRVIADQDTPGLKHAADLCQRLDEAGVKTLMAVCGEHKDPCDWLEANPGATHQDFGAALVPLSWHDYIYSEPDQVTDQVQDQDFNYDGDPIPLVDHIESVPFNLDVFPDWAKDMVQATAEDLEVPVDFPASLFLGAVSAAVIGRVTFRCGWTEEAGLYIAAAMPSGSGKSPVFRKLITGWLHNLEEQLVRDTQEAVRRSEVETMVAEQRLRRLQDQASKSNDHDERRMLVAEIISERKLLEERQAPRIPQLWVDDITPERLAITMSETGGPIVLATAEGGPFEMMSGRYSDNQSANLDVYLKGYTGEALSVKRVKRETITVYHPAMAMCLAVQPQVLEALAKRPELTHKGLVPRFLFALPKSNIGLRKRNTNLVPATMQEGYNAILLKLAMAARNLTEPESGSEDLKKIEIETTPEARAEFLLWTESLEPRRAKDGDLEAIAEWSVKLESSTIRIAGLLALAWRGLHADTKIEFEDMSRAISLSEYWIREARKVYGLWDTDPLVSLGIEIVNWMQEQDLKYVTRRDIMRQFRGKFPSAKDVNPVIRMLVDKGILRPEDDELYEMGRWNVAGGDNVGRRALRFLWITSGTVGKKGGFLSLPSRPSLKEGIQKNNYISVDNYVLDMASPPALTPSLPRDSRDSRDRTSKSQVRDLEFAKPPRTEPGRAETEPIFPVIDLTETESMLEDLGEFF